MLEELRTHFLLLKQQHYLIINSYIMNCLKIEEIQVFERQIMAFREKLYAFLPEEENIYEIAKMKSVVQHYITEILEDEEVLNVAYRNQN